MSFRKIAPIAVRRPEPQQHHFRPVGEGHRPEPEGKKPVHRRRRRPIGR
jgi:hypothetical protein